MWEQQKNADEPTQATTLGDMLMMIAAHDQRKPDVATEPEERAPLNHRS